MERSGRTEECVNKETREVKTLKALYTVKNKFRYSQRKINDRPYGGIVSATSVVKRTKSTCDARLFIPTGKPQW